LKPSIDVYKQKIGTIAVGQFDKLDIPDQDIYYCRAFTFKKTKIKYVSRKFKKVRYMTQYRKKYCLARMNIVPAHTRGNQFFAHYAYCPIHNMKLVLGY